MDVEEQRREAAAALALVERAAGRMKVAISSGFSAYHFIIWGVVWMAMPIMARFVPQWPASSAWLAAGGVLASLGVGWWSSRRVRLELDPRILGSMALFAGFGLMLGLTAFAGLPAEHFRWGRLYVFICVACLLAYALAGLWLDRSMLWLGVVLGPLLVAGYFFAGEWFWLWAVLFAGLPLAATGVYIRLRWR